MPKNLYELEIISFSWDTDFENPYPSFKISQSGRFLCGEHEEALTQIQRLAQEDTKNELYRFILRLLPLDERLYIGDFIKLWVYDTNGDLLDHSLCSDCASAGKQNEFKGRPEDLIRFNRGDIVEWFDINEAHLGIVTGLPMTPQQYKEIMIRYNRERAASAREWFLDWTDDDYTVVFGPDFISSHEHPYAPFVSNPTFEVPTELRRKLEEAYQKVLSEE